MDIYPASGHPPPHKQWPLVPRVRMLAIRLALCLVHLWHAGVPLAEAGPSEGAYAQVKPSHNTHLLTKAIFTFQRALFSLGTRPSQNTGWCTQHMLHASVCSGGVHAFILACHPLARASVLPCGRDCCAIHGCFMLWRLSL